MDHLVCRINNVRYDVPRLLESLAAAGIKPSLKLDTESKPERVLFSTKVGKHRRTWLVRLLTGERALTCSGGVSKTFFGHNLWVFNNEHIQLQAILTILSRHVAQFEGLALPDSLGRGSFEAVSIERVELTNHHEFPSAVARNDAIARIWDVFKVLAPNRLGGRPPTLDDPGCPSIGATKSTKECRAYNPAEKFDGRPVHVSEDSWSQLTAACAHHLRVEMIVSKREVKQLGLETIDSWRETSKVSDYLAKKYRRYGLSVAYEMRADTLLPEHVRATNPTFVEYARHWFTNGERGTLPNKSSGSYNRFRRFMLDNGFNVNVSFERHQHLAHGLSEILRVDRRAELIDELRRNPELFCRWWETD